MSVIVGDQGNADGALRPRKKKVMETKKTSLRYHRALSREVQSRDPGATIMADTIELFSHNQLIIVILQGFINQSRPLIQPLDRQWRR
jgi:hypothetical protein